MFSQNEHIHVTVIWLYYSIFLKEFLKFSMAFLNPHLKTSHYQRFLHLSLKQLSDLFCCPQRPWLTTIKRKFDRVNLKIQWALCCWSKSWLSLPIKANERILRQSLEEIMPQELCPNCSMRSLGAYIRWGLEVRSQGWGTKVLGSCQNTVIGWHQ